MRARFFSHPLARPALIVVAVYAAIAVLAPLLALHAPAAQLDIVALQNRPPSLAHPFGTDALSRDVWSRVAYGARVSLGVGLLAALVMVGVGTLVGATAGYAGGRTDAVLMRLVDVGLAVPRIFVVLLILAVGWRIGATSLALLIGLTGWFATSRLVRADVLVIRRRPYVEAARALGLPAWRILARHVLPNAAATILVSLALGVAHAMLLESSLSFLGAGVQPPAPSWGNMIADGRDQLTIAPWTSAFPGLALTLAVLGFHGLADALRHTLDPNVTRITIERNAAAADSLRHTRDSAPKP
jgi:peptide/nickel transport system permease protein